jgi:Phosphotransferase enzyme family
MGGGIHTGFHYIAKFTEFDRPRQPASRSKRREYSDRCLQPRQENLVLEVNFGEEEYWVARIQLPASRPPAPFPGYDRKYHSYKSKAELLSEVATMKYVKSHTNIPVPEVYGFCAEENNAVGAMYVFMSGATGQLLDLLPKIPDQFKHSVYSQYATIILELSSLQWPNIGLLQHNGEEFSISTSIIEEYYRFPAFTSSQAFYTNRAENFLRRKMKEGNEDWITFAWICLQAINKYLQPNWNLGPFPLRHPDLNNCNVLFDEKYKITAVIDWTATSVMPMESFLATPTDFRYHQFVDDKIHFTDIFEEVEQSWKGSAPFAQFMRSNACRIVEIVDQYASYGNFPQRDAERLVRLVYGEDIQWGALKILCREWLDNNKFFETGK